MEQYSGSVGYANRVTTSGAQNGTDHACIIILYQSFDARLARIAGEDRSGDGSPGIVYHSLRCH